jgi:hypothetical protein
MTPGLGVAKRWFRFGIAAALPSEFLVTSWRIQLQVLQVLLVKQENF